MNLPRRDVIATGCVLLAALVYLLWAFDSSPAGMNSVRVSGAVVLALGFAASATAVVPSFVSLLHGSKVYLTVTSLIGLAALVAGLVMLISANETSFGVLTAALAALWIIATIHHVLLARTPPPSPPAARRQHLVGR